MAYETHTVVSDIGEIVLRGLSVEPGRRVKVTVELEDENWGSRIAALEDLFRRTQGLPEASTLTDEDIDREIAAHRSSAP